MAVGVSEFSTLKWDRLRYLMEVHAKMVKGIIRRGGRRTCLDSYYYIDLYAGPGFYEERHGHDMAGQSGSPIVALRVLESIGVDYRLFLADPEEHDALRESLICLGRGDLVKNVYARCCALSVDMLLAWQPTLLMYGLVFIDPNGYPDWDALKILARRNEWYCMDFLVNVNAAIHKRCLKSRINGEDRRPTDRLKELRKKHIYLWNPHPSNPHQFTLAFLSNGGFPEFRKLGFHRLDSPEGQEIARVIDYSAEERKDMPVLASAGLPLFDGVA